MDYKEHREENSVKNGDKGEYRKKEKVLLSEAKIENFGK